MRRFVLSALATIVLANSQLNSHAEDYSLSESKNPIVEIAPEVVQEESIQTEVISEAESPRDLLEPKNIANFFIHYPEEETKSSTNSALRIFYEDLSRKIEGDPGYYYRRDVNNDDIPHEGKILSASMKALKAKYKLVRDVDRQLRRASDLVTLECDAGPDHKFVAKPKIASSTDMQRNGVKVELKNNYSRNRFAGILTPNTQGISYLKYLGKSEIEVAFELKDSGESMAAFYYTISTL